MYTSEGRPPVRIQRHRVESGSPLHPFIQRLPHTAFKVDNLDRVLEGETPLLGPYFPMPLFRVALIDLDRVLLEFIETSLTEEEIWSGGLSREGQKESQRLEDRPEAK